jgi:hypothetical protein
MNNYWGPQDEEDALPDWMDPRKCHQLNEQKKQRQQMGKDLNSVIQDCLKKPLIPVIIDSPKE